MGELPSFDELREEHDLDESKVGVTVDGDGWRAISHPDVESGDKHGAPFPWIVVGDSPDPEVVGDKLTDRLTEMAEEAWRRIEQSEDPLGAITELEAEDLVVD